MIPAHLVNDPVRVHNPMFAEEDIRITVGDVNDEIPTFNEPLYQIEFPEIVTAADRNRWHQISNNVRIIVTDQDGVSFTHICLMDLAILTTWMSPFVI